MYTPHRNHRTHHHTHHQHRLSSTQHGQGMGSAGRAVKPEGTRVGERGGPG
jgi:hypothetical protein